MTPVDFFSPESGLRYGTITLVERPTGPLIVVAGMSGGSPLWGPYVTRVYGVRPDLSFDFQGHLDIDFDAHQFHTFKTPMGVNAVAIAGNDDSHDRDLALTVFEARRGSLRRRCRTEVLPAVDRYSTSLATMRIEGHHHFVRTLLTRGSSTRHILFQEMSNDGCPNAPGFEVEVPGLFQLTVVPRGDRDELLVCDREGCALRDFAQGRLEPRHAPFVICGACVHSAHLSAPGDDPELAVRLPSRRDGRRAELVVVRFTENGPQAIWRTNELTGMPPAISELMWGDVDGDGTADLIAIRSPAVDELPPNRSARPLPEKFPTVRHPAQPKEDEPKRTEAPIRLARVSLLTVLRRVAPNAFVTEPDSEFPWQRGAHFHAADLDADGDVDVLVTGGSRLGWLRNDRTRGFVWVPFYPTGD